MNITKNYTYNSILTISQYIIPLITFPYLNRVLGVEKIGVVNFVDSIVNYFIMFSSMGITIIGIRQTAVYKGNYEKLSDIFSELFTLHAIFTVIVILIYVLSINIIYKLYIYKELLYVGILKIIFTLLLVEWFYKGIENFKYITIRSIILRSIFVLFVFVFVRSEGDYSIYYIFLSGLVVINALFNWIYLNKYIKVKIKINIKRHIKPYLTTGAYILFTSLYTTFNISYLGFVTNLTEVGYYSTSVKIFTISLGLFSAFSTVMLPRMSAIINNNEQDKFLEIIDKSFKILFIFSVPTIILIEILAPQIIYIIAGQGYEGAILPIRIIAPLIFIVGLAQIFALQILMPLKKDLSILIASIIGGAVGISLNIILVSTYKTVGTSIVLFISESVVTLFLFYCSV